MLSSYNEGCVREHSGKVMNIHAWVVRWAISPPDLRMNEIRYMAMAATRGWCNAELAVVDLVFGRLAVSWFCSEQLPAALLMQ